MIYNLMAIEGGIGQFISNLDPWINLACYREKRRGNADCEYCLPHSHRRRILTRL